jgi:hypothetical protein
VADQDDALVASQLVFVQSAEKSEASRPDVTPRPDVRRVGREITRRVTDIIEEDPFGNATQ